MHPVDPLVDMPMPHVPCLIIQCVLDGIQPLFRAVVNFGLVNSGQKALCGDIFERTCMGKDNIDFPVSDSVARND